MLTRFETDCMERIVRALERIAYNEDRAECRQCKFCIGRRTQTNKPEKTR